MKVVELKAFEVSAILINDNPAQVENWPIFPYRDISPIPLTPEILEAAGVVIGEDWTNDFTYLKKSEDGEGYDLICDFIRASRQPIQHLHQLQNLYHALTGEELAVKLLQEA